MAFVYNIALKNGDKWELALASTGEVDSDSDPNRLINKYKDDYTAERMRVSVEATLATVYTVTPPSA